MNRILLVSLLYGILLLFNVSGTSVGRTRSIWEARNSITELSKRQETAQKALVRADFEARHAQTIFKELQEEAEETKRN